MDPLSNDTPKDTFEKRRPVLFVIAGILSLCCLIGAMGMIYYVINSPKPVFSPWLTSAIPEESLPYSEEDLTTAISYIINNGNCDAALPLLDGVIANTENNGDAYYYRAFCHHTLTNNQTVEQIYREDALLAQKDVDLAIIHGVNDFNGVLPGDPYFLRYLIFEDFQGIAGTRAERDSLAETMIENLSMATALGTTDKIAPRWMPLLYFTLDRCEEGFAALDRIHEQEGLSAPPSASLYNMEAHGYVCTEDFEKALEYVDKGLALDVQIERLYFRAIILYHMGRLDESLAILNQLIEERPNYNGIRYYLRALIHYELGRHDLAEADLQAGAVNTWRGAGLDSYLLGLMAIDDQDNELAIQHLQQAEANLVSLYYPLLPKIEGNLKSLGAEPLPRENTFEFISTPMSSIPASSPPPAYEVNGFGFQLPPNPVPVNMHKGTGPFTLNSGAYPVIHFFPNQFISVESVNKITLHMLAEEDAKDILMSVLLWQPTTGKWTVIATKPREDIEVEGPGLHVDNAGNVYISIFPTGTNVYYDNIWLTLEVVTNDGSVMIVDLDKETP